MTSNRRSLEFRAARRFEDGLAVRGRVQVFTDSLEHANAQYTDTLGVNLTGPILQFLVPGLSISWDTFHQAVENRPRTTNNDTFSTDMNLSAPLPAGWNGRVGASLQETVNDVANTTAVTRQLTLGLDRGLTLLGFTGSISPGFTYRSIGNGAAHAREYDPSVSLILAGGPHSMSLDYDYLIQNRLRAGVADLRTHNAAGRYGYRTGPHRLGFEIDYIDRIPEGTSATRSYRAGVFWTWSFDKPREVAGREVEPIGPQAAPLEPVESGPVGAVLEALPPGLGLATARERLAAVGIVGGIDQPGVVVYDARLLPEIDQRQRVTLEHANGVLSRSALIIEFDNVGNLDTTARTFERVREALLLLFGSPSLTHERGTFTVNLVNDVNSDQLVRLMEWNRPAGVIRFGIPRRLDRQVRMEVQYAASFPPPSQTRWSLETVR